MVGSVPCGCAGAPAQGQLLLFSVLCASSLGHFSSAAARLCNLPWAELHGQSERCRDLLSSVPGAVVNSRGSLVPHGGDTALGLSSSLHIQTLAVPWGLLSLSWPSCSLRQRLPASSLCLTLLSPGTHQRGQLPGALGPHHQHRLLRERLLPGHSCRRLLCQALGLA